MNTFPKGLSHTLSYVITDKLILRGCNFALSRLLANFVASLPLGINHIEQPYHTSDVVYTS